MPSAPVLKRKEMAKVKKAYFCKECGYVAKCEACDVSITYHRDEDCLKCHYCGAKYRVPTRISARFSPNAFKIL